MKLNKKLVWAVGVIVGLFIIYFVIPIIPYKTQILKFEPCGVGKEGQCPKVVGEQTKFMTISAKVSSIINPFPIY